MANWWKRKKPTERMEFFYVIVSIIYVLLGLVTRNLISFGIFKLEEEKE